MSRPTRDDIQRAHDKLWAVVMGEIELGLSAEALHGAKMQLAVLCWVLGHDTDHQADLIQRSDDLVFVEVLELIDREALKRGYRLQKSPAPFRGRRPGRG